MTILETLAAKAQADDVYAMTLEELIQWHENQRYTPIGQATLNHLEQLQSRLQADTKVSGGADGG
jgi:hypothetical protein